MTGDSKDTGMTSAVHIVAEAGTTHEGDVDTALRLIAAAQGAGADSVKFQFIDPVGLYLTRLRQDGALVDNPVVAAREAQRLSRDEWHRVAAYAAEHGIPFSASVFDVAYLRFLETLNPPYIKIASTDTNNHALIEAACAGGRTILLSTGMSALGEIEAAVEVVTRAGGDLVLMHCVSAYPCPAEIANVGFVGVLKAAFGVPVGFSDHTESSVAAVAAVALGATWIEKHMTLDRAAKGFDHAYAMEPAMLAAYIGDIRAAEAALAPRHPKVGPQENAVRTRARRSLWAARDLPVGHVLSAEDILVVRPAGPLAPSDLPHVLGRRLARPVMESTAVRFEDLE